MWLIAGTVPDNHFNLSIDAVWADSEVNGDELVLPDSRRLPIARGTTALAATALLGCRALGAQLPRFLLAGDAGSGAGSEEAYHWLSANLAEAQGKLAPLTGLTFHYFYPDVDGHNRVYMACEALSPKPLLVADAGFMYVAKMSGYATSYDVFTPDVGELAFLADEKAPHPFYTRGFLLAQEEDMPNLLKRALAADNCPRNMIIKGRVDHIVCDGELVATVAEPSESAMEAIGGTGDIVTGLLTAYLASGQPICKSELMAARAARQLAAFCKPIPATQAAELIAHIPEVLLKSKAEIERE